MQIDLISHGFYEKLPDFRVKTLKRSWDMLLFVVDGEYEITFKGEQKRVILRKNEIALIPMGAEIERRVNSPVTYYYVSFYSQPEHQFYPATLRGKIKLPQGQVEAFFKMLERAFLLFDDNDLLVHIVRHVFAENYLFCKNNKVKSKPFSEEVENAIRYMRNNLEKKIDMDELAERVFLSHSGLIWKFKQELNTTPSRYLSVLRLSKAKQLLLNYPYSITEISDMCGYANPYYFTNAFRRYCGMSPTNFRKKYLTEKVKFN